MAAQLGMQLAATAGLRATAVCEFSMHCSSRPAAPSEILCVCVLALLQFNKWATWLMALGFLMLCGLSVVQLNRVSRGRQQVPSPTPRSPSWPPCTVCQTHVESIRSQKAVVVCVLACRPGMRHAIFQDDSCSAWCEGNTLKSVPYVVTATCSAVHCCNMQPCLNSTVGKCPAQSG
jgi:hypothetical protein